MACDCVSDAQRMHRDVLFVERRNKLLAEPDEAEHRRGEEEDRGGDDGQRRDHGVAQERPVNLLQSRDEAVLGFLHAPRKTDRDQGGD
jgi:hypothetical protein